MTIKNAFGSIRTVKFHSLSKHLTPNICSDFYKQPMYALAREFRMY